MPLPLALLLAIVSVGYEKPTSRYCPAKAIGYARVVKDGYLIANGTGHYDPHSRVLTAWFPPNWATAHLFMRLTLNPVC